MKVRGSWLCIILLIGFSLVMSAQNEDRYKTVSAAGVQIFAANSVLSTGQWSKIRVSSTGVYKITFDQLKQMGITNPQNVHVHGYGGAMLPESFTNAYLDDLPETPIYIGGDYILFYAQGPVSWQYDATKMQFVHTVNPYSNYGYYFVTQTAIAAKQITTTAAESLTPTTNIDYFLDRDVHEKDVVNLATSGREFYGEKFTGNTSSSFGFSFPNTDASRQGQIRVNAIATSTSSSSMSVAYNGTSLGAITFSFTGTYDYAISGSGSYSYTPTSDSPSFTLQLNPTTSSVTGYLNYIEANQYRKLSMTSAVLPFRNPDYLNQNAILQYTLSAAGSNVKIWNVTDPQNITEIPTTRNSTALTFISSAQNLQEYLAIDPAQASTFSTPEIVETNVPNQNLHSLEQTDMVIIAPLVFTSQAERLAQKHREKDNLSVVVVTPEQIYNEFSSGTPDATAYRRLMKMFYNRAKAGLEKAPKYLLLFGRGCYDNRGLLSTSSDLRQLLVFESYNSVNQIDSYQSDDYFSFLDDTDGVNLASDQLDIGVGRFPVTTVDQAKAVVDKTIAYMDNTNTGYWKNRVCFIADDGDANLHMTQADTIAKWTANANPYLQVNKLYMDAYPQVVSSTGESYPAAKTKLLNLIKSGLLMLNYTGHGNHLYLANEQIITKDDVTAMYNQNLALWVTATCDFTRCDYTDVSAGESVLLNPSGGGIALFTTTRLVFSSDNFALNKQFAKNVFYKDANGYAMRLGDVMRLTKNALPGNSNKLNFILVGDPALRLSFPAPNYTLVIDSINGIAAGQSITVNALSPLKLKGHVNNPGSANVCSDFNGVVTIRIYDKLENMTTLANDAGSTSFVYQDRPTMLFAGNTEAKSGYFSIESIIPKDIDYKFGAGRINMYASDEKGREGQGDFVNFAIGGSNSALQWENNGPDVSIYLNTTAFVSGDKVNETPLFIAKVRDDTGINTVGNGIGHDMTVLIDQDPAQYYVVNDYFEPTVGDYKSGVVQYSLPTQSEGKHSLTFKVWDVLNNSTSKTIEYEVVKGLAPDFISLYNYPNPVVNGITNFVLEHNRPDVVLNVRISVFDLSGRLLNMLSTSTSTESTKTTIPWNVTDSRGALLKAGVYLFKIDISTQNGKVVSKTQKVIVTKQ
jgi:hypothetical protein